MNKQPLASIIIVTYNGQKYLTQCFESLYAGTYKNIEIICVDNGSSDGTIDFIKRQYPQVRLIGLESNLGLAVASNRGAEAAQGDYLFFYNNDTISDTHLIESLVNKCIKDPHIGICGCLTKSYDGHRTINAGVSCDIFGYPFQGNKVFYVDAAIFIPRSMYNILGGFDPYMFLYGEDRDICWRTWLLGYKVEIEKKAFFKHDSFCITQDIRDYSSHIRKRFLGEYAALRSLLKNYSGGFIFFILPLFISINVAECLLFALMGRGDVIRKVYAASYLQNYNDLCSLLRLRSRIQKARKISDWQMLKHMHLTCAKLELLCSWGWPKIKHM